MQIYADLMPIYRLRINLQQPDPCNFTGVGLLYRCIAVFFRYTNKSVIRIIGVLFANSHHYQRETKVG